MPSPMPARKAEVEYDNPRPRDAAIRNAVNGNYTAVNDNEPEYQGQTIDSDFNDSYAQQGLQPSVGGVQVQYKNKTNNQAVSQVRRYRIQAANNNVQQRSAAGVVRETKTNAVDIESKSRQIQHTPKRIIQTKEVVSPKSAVKRVKGSRVAYQNLSIGLWMWFFLQLPLALFSIAFFGIVYGMDSIENSIRNNPLRSVVGFTLDTTAKVGEKVGKATEALFGVDIAKAGIDVITGGFIAMHLVIYLIGLLTLMICSCAYLVSISPIKCLSGERATGKMIAFIVAFVGYALPIFNIFPWFIFWVIAVWRYPK